MVRHPGIAHRAQINGVKALQDPDPIPGHHLPMLQIVPAAPGKPGILKGKGSGTLRCLLQHLHSLF